MRFPFRAWVHPGIAEHRGSHFRIIETLMTPLGSSLTSEGTYMTQESDPKDGTNVTPEGADVPKRTNFTQKGTYVTPNETQLPIFVYLTTLL